MFAAAAVMRCLLVAQRGRTRHTERGGRRMLILKLACIPFSALALCAN